MKICSLKKPLILSTGMASLEEVKSTLNVIKSEGIKNDLVALVKKFNLEPEQEKDLIDYILPKGTAWTDKINIIYQKLIQAGVDAKKASSELSKEISTWYKKKLPLDVSAFFSDQEFKSNEFVNSLAKQLGRDYFKEHIINIL